jgi:hypothetical protein
MTSGDGSKGRPGGASSPPPVPSTARRVVPSASAPPKLPPIPPVRPKDGAGAVAANPLASVADDDLDGLVDSSLSETPDKQR